MLKMLFPINVMLMIIPFAINDNVHIGYYTGSCLVRLDIFTSLMYFVESTGQDKIQRQAILSISCT